MYYKTDSDQTGSIDIPFDLSVGLAGDYSYEDLSNEELENADTWYLIDDTDITLEEGEKIENSDRLICNGSGINAALTISGSGSMTFGSVEVEEVEIAGGLVRGAIANTSRRNYTLNITGGEYRLDNGWPEDYRVNSCTVNINGGVLRSYGAIRSRNTTINVTDGALYAKTSDGEDALFVSEFTLGSGIAISEPAGGDKRRDYFDDNVANGRGYHIVVNGNSASEVFIRKSYSSDAIILDISPNELITFGDLKKYVTPTELKEVTIENDSPFPVRFVSASADDFEITETDLPIITAGKSHTFHVKAKPGLEVGEHTGWMTFVSSDDEEVRVQLKITITANNAKAEFTDHAVEGNAENAIVEFDDLGAGYDESMIESETVTIKNTGLEPLTFVDVTSTAFSVSLLDERNLPVGESMQLEVTPKLNLAVGTHDENITISTEQGFTLSLLAKFEVREASPAAAYLTAEDGESLGQNAANPLPFPIRYTTDGKDDSWQPSFWIKNGGNVRFRVRDIVDYTATKNTFAWDKDTFVYPGQAVKVTATINHAETDRSSGADITFLYADGTTGTSKVYFSEKAGLAGTYEASEIAALSEDADLYRLVGNTEITLSETDDLTFAPPAKAYSSHVELAFSGSNKGKVTFDSDLPDILDSADITIRISGGNIRAKKSFKMYNGELVISGGSLTGENSDSYYGVMEVGELTVSGGELNWPSIVEISNRFTASGGRMNTRGIRGIGAGLTLIPEVTIKGNAYVYVGGTSLAAERFTLKGTATLKVSNESGSPAVRFQSQPDIADGLLILSPENGGIGTFKENSETYYTICDQDGHPASTVRISASGDAENASFSIDKTKVRFEPVYKGQYNAVDHAYPSEKYAVVRVTNTGDTTLFFTWLEEHFIVSSAGNVKSARPGESITLQIAPAYDLEVGTYEEDIVISTAEGDSKTIHATCEVVEPSYLLTVTPSDVDFGQILEDEEFEAVTVTVSNPGDMAQEVLAPIVSGDADKFTVTGLPTTDGTKIQSGKSLSFSIIPKKESLASETAKLTISFKTRHGEEVSVTATAGVVTVPSDSIFIRAIPSVRYNGKAQKPQPKVYFGTTELSADDFTVSYANNTNAGNPESSKKGKSIAPTVTVKGKGNFAGSASVPFTIDPISMADVYTDTDSFVRSGALNAHFTLAYTGKEIKVTPVLKCDIDGKTVTLKKNVDYLLDKEKVINSDTIKVTGIGNYTGIRDIKVNVVQNRTLISGASFAAIPAQPYQGKKIVLETLDNMGEKVRAKDAKGDDFVWTVTYKGKTLVSGVDYKLGYEANKEVGTASVHVYGINDYAGMVTKTFKITGIDMKKVTIPNDFSASTAGEYENKAFIYTGEPIRAAGPEEGVQTYGIDLTYQYKDPDTKKQESMTLIKGTHYTVSYENNEMPGTATVVFTGKGEFTGTVKKTFKIAGYDAVTDQDSRIAINWPKDIDFGTGTVWKTMEAAQDANELPSYFYIKGGVKPEPVVVYAYGGTQETLQAGTDYTLAWSNHTKPGRYNARNKTKSIAPTVTITFKGRFTGKTARTFTIENGELHYLSATDVAAQPNKTGLFRKTKITVRDSAGQILKAGTDYSAAKDIEYTYADDTVVTVKNGGKWEEKPVAKDSPVLDTHCIPAGTRITVRVQSKGYYDKPVSGTFLFAKNDFTNASVTIPDQMYTGSPITLGAEDLTVSLKGVEGPLTYDPNDRFHSDFTIESYDQNTNAGTATVVLKGNPDRGYAGEKTVSFKIVARQMYETIHYDANADSDGYGLYKVLKDNHYVQDYANYKENYRIVGTMKDSVIARGGKLTKSKLKVERKDGNKWVAVTKVKLDGWNTEQDGSGTSFEDQGVFTLSRLSELICGGDWTLYAQWKVVP